MYQDKIENPELKIVPREKWGALPPKFTEALPLPAERLMFICTNTERCMSKDECITAMRTIQRYYMEEKGMPDLPYSFLIGGDLRVYEGRGWGVMIRRRDMEDWVDERVVFGLIGHERVNDNRMNKMVQKGYDLMYHAINNEYIVNFDEYGQQDEDAIRYERKDMKQRMQKEAKKECEEDVEKERKKAEKKEQDIKKWEKSINEIHFEDARKPKFMGNKEELKKVMKDNKEAFNTLKLSKELLKESESELDSTELLMSEEDDKVAPI